MFTTTACQAQLPFWGRVARVPLAVIHGRPVHTLPTAATNVIEDSFEAIIRWLPVSKLRGPFMRPHLGAYCCPNANAQPRKRSQRWSRSRRPPSFARFRRRLRALMLLFTWM